MSDPNDVVDIRKKNAEVGATIMIYKKAEVVEEGINQLWDLQLADPPKQIDSSDDEDDDNKSARLSAWFGSWWGWGDDDKNDLLREKELEKAHKKVYEKKKSNLTYEVIAGAVAAEAVKQIIAKQEQEGQTVYFKGNCATQHLVKAATNQFEIIQALNKQSLPMPLRRWFKC